VPNGLLRDNLSKGELMPTPRSVVIYGNTLALAGIAIALKRQPTWKVITLEIEEADLAQQLKAHSPDVIIFDQSQADAQTILACAEQRHDLLAIGIEANSDCMVLWSGHSNHVLTIQDLTQAIDALPDSIHQTSLRSSFIDQATNRITVRFTRRQKLTMAVVIIGLCVVGLIELASSMDNANQVPLAGAALASDASVAFVLAFIVGILVGGVAVGLVLWSRRYNHNRQ
jgi:uncharacterized integral membrane protein